MSTSVINNTPIETQDVIEKNSLDKDALTTFVIIGFIIYSIIILIIIYFIIYACDLYSRKEWLSIDKAIDNIGVSLVVTIILIIPISGVLLGFYKKYDGNNKTDRSNKWSKCFLSYGIIGLIIMLITIIVFLMVNSRYNKIFEELSKKYPNDVKNGFANIIFF